MVFDGCRVSLMRNVEVEGKNPVDEFLFVTARNAPVWCPRCYFLLTSQLFGGFLRILLLKSQLFRVFLILANVASVAEYLVGPSWPMRYFTTPMYIQVGDFS